MKDTDEDIYEELERLYYEIEEDGAADPDTQIKKAAIASYVLSKAVVENRDSSYFEMAREAWRIAVKYDEVLKEDEIINQKIAAVYLACLYMEQGQHLTAEGYLKHAVSLRGSYPNKMTDYYAVNLLCGVYMCQGNLKEAMPRARELYEMQGEEHFPAGCTNSDRSRGLFLYSTILHLEGKQREAAGLIREALEEGRLLPENNQLFDKLCCLMVQDTITSHTPFYLEEFAAYLKAAEQEESFNELNPVLVAGHYAVKALLYWLGEDETVLWYATSLLEELLPDVSPMAESDALSALFLLCAIHMECENKETAVSLMEKGVKLHQKGLGRALVYQNRKRLWEYLAAGNTLYAISYSLFRACSDAERAYEAALNYKNLLSLVTVYANTRKAASESDSRLSDEINAVLDQMADVQTSSLWGKEVSPARSEKLSRELSEKEYLYARQFAGQEGFKPCTMNEVAEALPDDSVFIEYVNYYENYYMSMLDDNYHDEDMVIAALQADGYCFRKKDGICTVKQFTVKAPLELFATAGRYMEQMGKRVHKKLYRMRKELYNDLIKPVEQELLGISNLYIAPDGSLSNLPFDVLTDSEGCMLGDLYRIIMVDTGRDFLKKGGEHRGEKALVAGNPAYDCLAYQSKEEKDESRERVMRQAIGQLPFSELESRIVAQRLGCNAFVGMDADKSVVDKIADARWVHLATHGMHETECGADNWLSCELLFAGAESWRKNEGEIKGENTYPGNGIVTADEISRMDFSHTELVVLSACYTGRIVYGDMAGMRTAFRAAGVKYIVCALWAVDDIAAAVFMAFFYENLRTLPVEAALQEAKIRLRNVKVREVKEFLVSSSEKYHLSDEEGIRNGIAMVEMAEEQSGEDAKIFSDPFYWSAFICMQNSF